MDQDRIYIVRDEDIEALGTYMPVLNCVSLRWENNYKESSLLFKGKMLGIEKVFYHEIGHHVHRHTFGKDPDQEKEANEYAFKIMQQSHLNLDRAARFISSITKDLDDNWKKGLIGIELKDKETGEKLGNITEDDMEFLMSHLVNEYEGDRDFYINQSTVDLLAATSTNAKIVNLIKTALGPRLEMETEWSGIYA